MTQTKLVLSLVAVVLLVVSHGIAWRQGGLEARKDVAEQGLEEMRAAWKYAAQANDRAVKAEEALLAELSKPQAAPQVRTVISENPSNCVVPKPADDQLRKSRSEANAAIRRSLGSR